MARKALTDKQKETNAKNLAKGKATQFKAGREAARAGSRGGRKSGQVRREKRTLQDQIKLTLEQAATPALKKQIAKNLDMEVDTIADVVGASVVINALKGNNKCLDIVNQASGANDLDNERKTEELKKIKLENEKVQFELETLKGKQAEVLEQLSRNWNLPITDITTDFVEMYRDIHKAFEGKNDIHEW